MIMRFLLIIFRYSKEVNNIFGKNYHKILSITIFYVPLQRIAVNSALYNILVKTKRYARLADRNVRNF